ncbi:MAG: GAF domain-containing protein [Bacteroidales bacterium]|nr:GAF domain-containing protein [Bacteroidales bacterium]
MDENKRSARYERILKQFEDLIHPHHNALAMMATACALLSHKIGYFFWTGFYLLDKGDLIVGPYQGPLACIKLEKNKGVCWAGINTGKTLIVPDVHQFPGHIACDSRSNSEIVVPLRNACGNMAGVLDVDSKEWDAFSETDGKYLEKIASAIGNYLI